MLSFFTLFLYFKAFDIDHMRPDNASNRQDFHQQVDVNINVVDEATKPHQTAIDSSTTPTSIAKCGSSSNLYAPRVSFSSNLNSLKISSKLLPIASCEAIHKSNSDENETTATPKASPKNIATDTVLTVHAAPVYETGLLHRTSGLIENVLNNLARMNVSDGIVTGSKQTRSENKANVSSMPLGASFLIPEETNNSSSANNSRNASPILYTTSTSTGPTISQGGQTHSELDSTAEDYNSDEDTSLRDNFSRVNKPISGKRSAGNDKSSLNGSISSAASVASRLGVSWFRLTHFKLNSFCLLFFLSLQKIK